MKMLKRLAVLLLITIFLFSSTTAVVAQDQTDQAQQEQQDPNFIYLQGVKEFIKKHYKYEVEDEELLEGALETILRENPELLDKAIEGMFDSLDPYSTYFDETEYNQFSTTVDGQYGGLGIVISNRDGYVTVVSPMDDSPGKRAGLKPGDKIVSVNDIDISGYDTNLAVPLMRGEPGTSVTLGIKRKGHDGILYFTIVRETIKLNPISHEVLEDNIGYIKISDFNANTEEYLQQALTEFDEQGITKLIIDVRNNPGGSLKQVVEVARHFVPKGPIVHIEYKDEKLETQYSELEETKYELVVLINEGSASASEILAGAVQDTEAGTIVGVKSFGKGTVQQLLPLRIGGAIKMTIARYLTPDKRAIDGDGIHPDIEVQNMKKKYDVSTLEKLEILRKPTLGDAGKDVLAAEQRLELLGFDIDEPDEMLDEKTFEAIKQFQAMNHLHPYGVLDFTTQMALERKVNELEIEIDKQLEKAIEILQRKSTKKKK